MAQFELLTVEPHNDSRSRSHMRTWERRLVVGDTAADRLQFESRILRGLDRRAHALPKKRGDDNSSLFDIEDNRSIRGRHGG